MKHHFVPSKRYNFPAQGYGDGQRHFQGSWLDKYNGLVYSESDDGGYCKFCVLFAHCQEVSELGVLVNPPLTNLKKATEKLKNHFISEERKSHHEAVQTALTVYAVKENRVLPIDQQLGSIRETLVKKNHLKLRSIAATVILCGEQAFALRSHLDHGPVMIQDDSANRGNFQALLRFRVNAGDQVLKEHLETASLSATYTSKEIQNQMISVCCVIIRNTLWNKIHKVFVFFSYSR